MRIPYCIALQPITDFILNTVHVFNLQQCANLLQIRVLVQISNVSFGIYYGHTQAVRHAKLRPTQKSPPLGPFLVAKSGPLDLRFRKINFLWF